VSAIASTDAPTIEEDAPRRPWRLLVATAWQQHRTKIGVAITLALVLIAVVGPFVTPYPPDQGVEGQFPYAPRSDDAVFGTDNLGRDTLSRFLAGGIVVVEAVFNYPGIGLLLVDAVRGRDVPVVQALALLIAGLYVVLNLLADLATILVSPRLRTSLS